MNNTIYYNYDILMLLLDDNHLLLKTTIKRLGRLRGLAVARSTTDHLHPGLNLGMDIFESCLILDFLDFTLLSMVARVI